MIEQVSKSVKAGARDVGWVLALSLLAAVLAAVALIFLGLAGYRALSITLPEWAAALIIGLVFLFVVVIVGVVTSKVAAGIGEVDEGKEAPPVWTNYGIPAEFPVDRLLRHARNVGLGALGRLTARYSTQRLLPALVPAAVGIIGFIAARHIAQRVNRRSE